MMDKMELWGRATAIKMMLEKQPKIAKHTRNTKYLQAQPAGGTP